MAVPVVWQDLPLNTDRQDTDGLQVIVTDVTGWYDTPEIVSNDDRWALSDGGLYGPKVLEARKITLTGVAVGPRAPLLAFRWALASRTVDREPSTITIGDPWIAQSLSATVRAAEQLRHTFLGPTAFRWQVGLTAADWRRYETELRQAIIRLGGAGNTGRRYRRVHAWRYANPDAGGGALLTNPGNVAAPVWAVYSGPLSETRLSDGTRFIRVAELQPGEQILLHTDTLVAQAEGGVSRAAYVLPGSQPLLVPAQQTVRWTLQGTGTGSVQLSWRGAYT